MTHVMVTGTSTATSQPRGATSSASGADETGFAASMTAVVTVNVSDEGDETQGAPVLETAESSPGEIEIEIEITTFEGRDLADNLDASSNRGTAEISITADGGVGVATDGIFFSDNPEVQMGETLTFTVPTELGDVQGATVTVSNLVDDETGAESALVIAHDVDGNEVLRCLVEGNDQDDVTVDIDVSFSKLAFKPVDNGSWTLQGNADFSIDRIDVRTGAASAGDPDQHGWGGFLTDFRGLFEERNFSMLSSVHRTRHRSYAQAFATRPSEADDAAQKDQEHQNEATRRLASVEESSEPPIATRLQRDAFASMPRSSL